MISCGHDHSFFIAERSLIIGLCTGYADELGLEDYGTVRVCSEATIIDVGKKYALVTIDEIDGDHNATARILKSPLG